MRFAQIKDPGARPKTALVLTEQEWQQMRNPIVEAQRKEELMETFILEKKEKKSKSKLMTANWPNTIASMQKEREKMILSKAQKEEKRRLQEYNEIMENKIKEKQDIIEKAKKMIYEKNESSRIINSGLVLSNILYERSKQIEFDKLRREKLFQKELEDRKLRQKLAEAFSKENYEERVKHEAAMQSYKNILDAQMVVVLQQRETQNKQKEKDKEDLENDQAELTLLKDSEMKELKERKTKLKEEQEMWVKINEEYREQKKKQDKEEAEMNSIYQVVQEKINKRRAEVESKQRQELTERRTKAQAESPVESHALREEESLRRALQENDEKLANELKDRELKKEKLRNELKAFEKEAELYAEEDAKRRLEMQRWEMLERLAIEDGDRRWKAARNEDTKKKQKEMREALLQQWEEQETRKKNEKWQDMSGFIEERRQETNALLKYCAEIEEAALQSGRPMYPVLAAIKRVKKAACLKEEKKKIPFLQSRVPIASVQIQENAIV